MAKVHLVIRYIKDLEIGRKISVRTVAQELGISEGTAYKAIKACEEEGYLKTLPRAGTLRVESPKEKKIKNLTYEDVLQIVEGELIGGATGIEKPIYKFIIGAMELDAMKRYIQPGGIVIVGNREAAQNLALKNGNGVLVTGGLAISEKIRKMADDLSIPVISSAYDSYTVAALINKALSQNQIRQRILYVSDIMTENPVLLNQNQTIEDWKAKVAKTKYDRFPVVDSREKLIGTIGPREALGKDGKDPLSKHMRKPLQVHPRTTVAYAAHLMDWEALEMLPVTEGDRLLGVISRGDVLKGLKERYSANKTSESIEDRLIEGFEKKEEDGLWTFTGKVTGEILDPIGTLSRSVLSMLIVKCTSVVLKNHNLYTEVDNVSVDFIRPLQPEHTFRIVVEPIHSSKSHSRMAVRVYNNADETVAIAMVSATH